MTQISSNYGLDYRKPSSPTDMAVKTVACVAGYDLAEKSSTTKKVGIILTSAAALAGIIYGVKHPDKVRKIFGKIKTAFTQKPNTEKVKNMSFDDFKKIGRFEKGKALINGKGFSGELTTKTGTMVEYKNGMLNMSIIPGKNGNNIYKYYNNGRIRQIHDYTKKVGTYFSSDGRLSWTTTGDVKRIGADGTVTRSKFDFITRNGKTYQIEQDIKTGRIIDQQLYSGLDEFDVPRALNKK